MEELIKKFRAKLAVERRSLKLWHREHYAEYVARYNMDAEITLQHYKYNYFIRQINTPDSMQSDLKHIITAYVG